jgi:hypothetical protein
MASHDVGDKIESQRAVAEAQEERLRRPNRLALHCGIDLQHTPVEDSTCIARVVRCARHLHIFRQILEPQVLTHK